jgi:hypothetical protein
LEAQMLRRLHPLLLLVLIAILALAACSGASAGAANGNGDTGTGQEVATLDESAASGSADGAGASPEASVDPQEALLAFAACMREHGVDMPDPVFESSGDGKVQFGVRIGGTAAIGEDGETGPDRESAPDQETLEAAHEACQEHLAGVVGPDGPRGEMSPEEQEQFLAFAKCMREHGVDMPDPQFGTGGGMVMIGGPAASGEPPKIPDEETLQAAQDACQDLLPGGGEGGGPRLNMSSGASEGSGPSTQSSTDEAAE